MGMNAQEGDTVPIIGGNTRFRKHQVGLQSVVGTAVAATRVLPYSGPIEVDLGYQDDDADTGSLDPIMKPYRTASEITSTWEGRANYNDIPYLFSSSLKGGVTPTGGTAKTWTYQVASLTADPFDFFSDEWGDDVTGDWLRGVGGVSTGLELTGNADLGPLEISNDMVYAFHQWGSNTSPTAPTAALTVDTSPTRVFLADCEVFIDSTAGAIGTTKATDTIHALNVSIDAELDVKRFANGSNTRFQAAAYGRGPRTIELELTLAKSSAAINEVDQWDADAPVTRYVELRFTSPTIITGSTPYSMNIRMPVIWREREDDEIENNTVIKLRGPAVYDSTLTYAFRAVVVNTLASL